MATPKSNIKATRSKSNGNPASKHGVLFTTAVRHLVDKEIEKSPELTYDQAQARVHRQLAEALGVTRGAVYQMRYRAVAAKYWARLERLTEGAVTAEQFEAADREGAGYERAGAG